MRLIDADFFKSQFRADTVTGTTIHRMIDKQPTAYDVEKVIKSLEEKAEISRECWNNFNDESAFGETNAYSTAINIARFGGEIEGL